MKHLKLTLLLFAFCHFCSAQDLIFTKQIKNAEKYSLDFDFIGAYGANDHFYVAGNCYGANLLDTIPLLANSAPYKSNSHSFISKYNSYGELLRIWSDSGGGSLLPEQLQIDTAGNIYVLARTSGNIIIDSVTIYTDIRIFSYLILKLDANLNLLWHKLFQNNPTTDNQIRNLSFAIDKHQDIVVIGQNNGTNNIDSFELSANDDFPFIAKLNASDGLAIWVKQIYGKYPCRVTSLKLTTDEAGAIIMAGSFSTNLGSTDYMVFNQIDTLRLSNSSTSNGFLAKYASNGDYYWANRIDTLNFIPTIACDRQNNIYWGGRALVKYNSLGNLLWSKDITNGGISHLINNGSSNYLLLSFNDSMSFNQLKFYGKGENSLLIKTNPLNGQLEWASKPYHMGYYTHLYTNPKGVSFISCKTFYSLLENNLLYHQDKQVEYLICINDTSYQAAYTNTLQGQLFKDLNGNCLYDSDQALSNIGVLVYPGSYYTATDAMGRFKLKVPDGEYLVKPFKTIGHAIKTNSACNVIEQKVWFNGTNILDSSSIFPRAYSLCPVLKVYLDRSPIAEKDEKWYGNTYVTIRNLGLDTVFNIQAKIKYPGIAIAPLYSQPQWQSYSPIDSIVILNIPFLAPQTNFKAEIFDSINRTEIQMSNVYEFMLRVEPISACYPEDSLQNYAYHRTMVIIPIGLEDKLKERPEVKVYPNPSNGLFTVHSPSVWLQEITLVDGLGKKAKEIHLQYPKGTHQLDCSDLSEGVYFLQMVDIYGNTFRSKWVKQ